MADESQVLRSVEILRPPVPELAERVLHGMQQAMIKTGHVVRVTKEYRGDSDLLMLYGVGAPDRSKARDKHVKSGRHAVTWDLGYFGRKKLTGYLRCSIDHDHPQAYLEKTAPDPARFAIHNIQLREDADPNGHIILVGLGQKSRNYLQAMDWEKVRLKALRERFPGREIVYRPKPGSPPVKLDCKMDVVTPIEQMLKGAALISCRHSNVTVDATVAGVPFECDDGAAMWLRDRPFTIANRLDFLRRLSWWQWQSKEADQAWQFVKGMIGAS